MHVLLKLRSMKTINMSSILRIVPGSNVSASAGGQSSAGPSPHILWAGNVAGLLVPAKKGYLADAEVSRLTVVAFPWVSSRASSTTDRGTVISDHDLCAQLNTNCTL